MCVRASEVVVHHRNAQPNIHDAKFESHVWLSLVIGMGGLVLFCPGACPFEEPWLENGERRFMCARQTSCKGVTLSEHEARARCGIWRAITQRTEALMQVQCDHHSQHRLASYGSCVMALDPGTGMS